MICLAETCAPPGPVRTVSSRLGTVARRGRLADGVCGARWSLSVHSRVVLISTGVLLTLGAAGFYLSERTNVLYGLPLWDRIMMSCFQSVTSRTAGFSSVPIGHLANVTLFGLIALMFVGGASGSCAGGIKTTSLAVGLAGLRAGLSGRLNSTGIARLMRRCRRAAWRWILVGRTW